MTFYDLWYPRMTPYHKKLKLTEALHFNKMSIYTSLVEELLVGTLLGDTAVVDDVDAVGIIDGTQAVSNDDGGSTMKKVGESTLYKLLGLGIEGRGGLIED